MATDATPTNDRIGTLDRGTALAGSVAEAPDVTINLPVEFPDHYPDESPTLNEPTAEDWAELGAMADEAAAQRFLDPGDRLTLDELIERQIEFYEGWQNEAGKMFALHMTELLIKYRGAGSAPTPAEAMARIEILEQDVRHDWEARGYDAGFEAGRREAMPWNGPLD
jgi:hypothetical protein